MMKVKNILLEGEKALARPILEDKLPLHNNSENHFTTSSSSSSSSNGSFNGSRSGSGSGSDTTEKECDSPARVLVFNDEKPVRNTSYISKYLAATSVSSEESAKTVLSGKWWLDDEDKE
jgi:hypothetical protein